MFGTSFHSLLPPKCFRCMILPTGYGPFKVKFLTTFISRNRAKTFLENSINTLPNVFTIALTTYALALGRSRDALDNAQQRLVCFIDTHTHTQQWRLPHIKVICATAVSSVIMTVSADFLILWATCMLVLFHHRSFPFFMRL